MIENTEYDVVVLEYFTGQKIVKSSLGSDTLSNGTVLTYYINHFSGGDTRGQFKGVKNPPKAFLTHLEELKRKAFKQILSVLGEKERSCLRYAVKQPQKKELWKKQAAKFRGLRKSAKTLKDVKFWAPGWMVA